MPISTPGSGLPSLTTFADGHAFRQVEFVHFIACGKALKYAFSEGARFYVDAGGVKGVLTVDDEGAIVIGDRDRIDVRVAAEARAGPARYAPNVNHRARHRFALRINDATSQPLVR